MNNRKVILIVLGIIIIGNFIFILNYLSPNFFEKIIENDNREISFVTRIIDGDTVVANGEHIRLLGIDADERGSDCYKEAKERLEELVFNKEVILEKDKTDKDQYGRYLRYIFLEGENINLKLVEEGLAIARFYDDRKYENEILEAEIRARKNNKGCKWISI